AHPRRPPRAALRRPRPARAGQQRRRRWCGGVSWRRCSARRAGFLPPDLPGRPCPASARMGGPRSTRRKDVTDVKLETPNGVIELPTVEGTEAPSGLDISKLLSGTGQVTLDVGFVNTASCRSAITYIDGDAGILRYRGYPIEQLAEKATFLETAYLLLEGELPTKEQLGRWEDDVRRHTYVHTNFMKFLEGFRYDAHPMGMLLG